MLSIGPKSFPDCENKVIFWRERGDFESKGVLERKWGILKRKDDLIGKRGDFGGKMGDFGEKNGYWLITEKKWRFCRPIEILEDFKREKGGFLRKNMEFWRKRV